MLQEEPGEVCRKNLVLLAKTFARATKRPLDRISAKFYGNVNFFRNLDEGEQTVSLKHLDRLVREFKKEWPDNVPWPVLSSARFRAPVKNTVVQKPKKGFVKKSRIT